MEYARRLLEAIGLEGRRLKMINVSSAMAAQFASAAAEFCAEIEKLGPSPLRAPQPPAREEARLEGEPGANP